MSSRRILVVYATGYGQTARIAGRMADLLRHVGDDVTVLDAARSPQLLTVRAYDGVIVGSPVAFGRHQRSIRRFVLEHQDELNTRPSVFFSVSEASYSLLNSQVAPSTRRRMNGPSANASCCDGSAATA